MIDKKLYAWIGGLAVLLLAGIYAIVRVSAEGHEVLGPNNFVTWGTLVSTYVFFLLTTSGLCILSSLGVVFGIKRYEIFGKKMIMLAIITMLAGFIAIGMDLGHPLRLPIMMLTSPNFESAIWWMGVLYTLYLIFLILEFVFLHRQSMKKARISGALGFVFVIAAPSTLAAVFGFAEVRPLYYGTIMPAFFILTAILSGAALILFVVLVEYRVLKKEMSADIQSLMKEIGKILGLTIGIALFLGFWRNAVGLYSPTFESETVYRYALFGPFSFYFLGIAVLMGLVVPLGILLLRRTMSGILVASALVLVGMFTERYVVTIGGQVVPMYPGQWAPMLAPYSPTGLEYLTVIFTMAFTALLYTLGKRFLKLEEAPER